MPNGANFFSAPCTRAATKFTIAMPIAPNNAETVRALARTGTADIGENTANSTGSDEPSPIRCFAVHDKLAGVSSEVCDGRSDMWDKKQVLILAFF